MKNLVVGILAHVDAGKTTLSEAMLYVSGHIKKMGRVDHQTAFLDTYELERKRGITIFSKQALLLLNETEITLLDTPGHVDFSTEMERTLQVLDYAILVINGTDGVQGHTQTLWKLLNRYQIPTFLFINKMDLDGTNRTNLMQQIKQQLHTNCIDFSDASKKQLYEEIAMCDEELLSKYIETEHITTNEISACIKQRKIYPCFFGSALKLDGVEPFLNALTTYTQQPVYPAAFGAKVYKIARDEQNNRLTYMKITGGSLKVKTALTNAAAGKQTGDAEIWEEKVNQIRVYSGARYQAVDQVCAGTVCAVTGLNKTYPGEGLGIERSDTMPVLTPVLTYRVLLPEGCEPYAVLVKLKQLEEEDPLLHIIWNEQLKEIHIQLMGEVQLEILKQVIAQRFHLSVAFDTGNIVYKETIQSPVEGVGHFEPLRHYAEVHLLLEPGKRGSGLQFFTACSEDLLDKNWQRLILTHLKEKEHLGVLTGSPITDMKITLVAGRAHLKHTEGGDFRQATYRAVRQGLKKATSILLEPYYDFQLSLPTGSVGRAMADLQKMHATFQPPITDGEFSTITGMAPVATMRDYSIDLTAYTKGRGKLFCTLKGYEPCHNAEEIIEKFNYDSEKDVENPADSVFCSHGAGYTVKWNEVEKHMHLGSYLKTTTLEETTPKSTVTAKTVSSTDPFQEDKELLAIFERTYGPIQYWGRVATQKRENDSTLDNYIAPTAEQEYLLVDGYNIIFAWEELKTLAAKNLDAARQTLMDLLCNYQSMKQCTLILVFDAYKVPQHTGEIIKYHNIYVVYTKEAETADMYIEKTTYQIGQKRRVKVATSDNLEQLIILGHGANRISADIFKADVMHVTEQIANIIEKNNRKNKPSKLF